MLKKTKLINMKLKSNSILDCWIRCHWIEMRKRLTTKHQEIPRRKMIVTQKEMMMIMVAQFITSEVMVQLLMSTGTEEKEVKQLEKITLLRLQKAQEVLIGKSIKQNVIQENL